MHDSRLCIGGFTLANNVWSQTSVLHSLRGTAAHWPKLDENSSLPYAYLHIMCTFTWNIVSQVVGSTPDWEWTMICFRYFIAVCVVTAHLLTGPVFFKELVGPIFQCLNRSFNSDCYEPYLKFYLKVIDIMLYSTMELWFYGMIP